MVSSRSYQVNVEEDGEVPLLRIHVVSARGLPRSSGAVGMPDPYVVVKFNGEKVWRGTSCIARDSVDI